MIQKIIKQEISAYNDAISLNPDFAPSQRSLLRLIDLYTMSKFRDSNEDSLGHKKVFYNIVNFPTETNAKMLDIDQKDIKLYAVGTDYWPVWLKEKELNFWMKNKYFGRDLNEFIYNWVKYGHLFLKKVDDKVKMIPPQNLIFRPDAEDLSKVPIIEKHEYEKDEFLIEADEKNWDNVEDVTAKKVFEVWLPKNYPEVSRNNYFITTKDGTILASDSRDCPYKDLAFKEVPGRLMGKGVVESLFEEQIYLNRIANYKADGLHWSSLHLFQSGDTRIASNLLTNHKNGDILTTNDEITPVVNEERNLPAYREEETRYQQNARQRSFTREPITGGRAPAGTPLGSTALQARMAESYFNKKKEKLASFLKEVIWDWVMPEFEKETAGKHSVLLENLLAGEDPESEKMFKMVVNEKTRQRKAELASKGQSITRRQSRIIKAIKARQLRKEELEIPKNMYKNLKHKINIVITGEQMDTAGKSQALQQIFQMLGSNPTILNDPRVKRVFNKMVEMSGINPKDLGLDQVETLGELATEQRAQRGGSIAAPRQQSPARRARAETRA